MNTNGPIPTANTNQQSVEQTHPPPPLSQPLMASMAPPMALGGLIAGMNQAQAQQAITAQIQMLQQLQKEQFQRAAALHQLGGMVSHAPFPTVAAPPPPQHQLQTQQQHPLLPAANRSLTTSDFASIVNTPDLNIAPRPPPNAAPPRSHKKKAPKQAKVYIPKSTKTRKNAVKGVKPPYVRPNKVHVASSAAVYSTIPTIQSLRDEPPPHNIPSEIITVTIAKSDTHKYLLSKDYGENLWKSCMKKAHSILSHLDYLLKPGTSMGVAAYFEICKHHGFTIIGKQFYIPPGWPRACSRVNEIKDPDTHVVRKPASGKIWYRCSSALIGPKSFRVYLVNVAERPWVLDWSNAWETNDWMPWLTDSLSTLGFKTKLKPPPQDWNTGVPCLRGIMRINNFRVTIQGFWSNHRCNLFRPTTAEAIAEAKQIKQTGVSEFMWSSNASNNWGDLPPLKDIRFGGQFIFKDQTGTEVNIPEKQIDVKFSENSEGNYNIAGEGSNEFGDFNIVGCCIKNHEGVHEVCIYKVFKTASDGIIPAGVDVESIQCSCVTCPNKTDESIPILLCDVCDEGFHTTCLGLTQVPEGDSWFCRRCASKRPRLVDQATELLTTLSKMVNSPSDGGSSAKERIDRMFMIAGAYGWTETIIPAAFGRKERSFTPSPTLTVDSELYWPKPRVQLTSYSMFQQYLKWVIDPEVNAAPAVPPPAPPPPPPPSRPKTSASQQPRPAKSSRGYSQPSSSSGTYHSLIISSNNTPQMSQNQILKTYTNHGEVFDRRYFREETIVGTDLPIFSAIPPPDYMPKESTRKSPLPNYVEIYGQDVMYDELRHKDLNRQELLSLAGASFEVHLTSKNKERDAFMLKCFKEEFKVMARKEGEKAKKKAAKEREEENYRNALEAKFPGDINKFLRDVHIESRANPTQSTIIVEKRMAEICQRYRIDTEECRKWFGSGFPEGAHEDPEKDRRAGWEQRLKLHNDRKHIETVVNKSYLSLISETIRGRLRDWHREGDEEERVKVMAGMIDWLHSLAGFPSFYDQPDRLIRVAKKLEYFLYTMSVGKATYLSWNSKNITKAAIKQIVDVWKDMTNEEVTAIDRHEVEKFQEAETTKEQARILEEEKAQAAKEQAAKEKAESAGKKRKGGGKGKKSPAKKQKVAAENGSAILMAVGSVNGSENGSANGSSNGGLSSAIGEKVENFRKTMAEKRRQEQNRCKEDLTSLIHLLG
ncbi:hypothetical protein TrST_g222 [Triparma strigata]|uniref:PHD-type domain-containing protein n=1 Tax=Triparma strigata TaxID=1606541 RepID=A0A9W7A939_9STRA|nr:hypothetical protein TrST_g222 [Triparma strigata]